MLRRVTPALLPLVALLSVASCASAAADERPRHKGTTARPEIHLAGDTVTASWIWKAPLRSIDTAVVQFKQKIGTGAWTVITPLVRFRGTTTRKVIARPAAGDSVEVCVWVVTVGADPSPTMCQQRARGVTPHPGADSLEVVSVIVKPDSARLEPNRVQQFCAGVRLSDERVVLTTNSAGVAACPPMFAGIPGWTAERVGTIRDVQLGILITGEWMVDGVPMSSLPDGYQPPAGHSPEVYQRVRVQVANAVKYGGEWWLKRPVKVPAIS